MNPKIDAFVERAGKWQNGVRKLRKMLLACGLTEELKWGKPCYAWEGKNVVIILPLKDYVALLFCKGALLKDAKGVLVKAGENTQAARQLRFTSDREIAGMERVVKAYAEEAMAVEKAGLEVVYKKASEFPVPEELQRKLDELPAFKTAFHALTPGRQRGYLLHFAAAKQAATREARVARYMPQILEGMGLQDEWKKGAAKKRGGG